MYVPTVDPNESKFVTLAGECYICMSPGLSIVMLLKIAVDASVAVKTFPVPAAAPACSTSDKT